MKKIQFFGAAGGVTGSSFLVTANNGDTVLVDLGMFQGEDDKGEINFLPLNLDIASLRAVFITHAHLDHCGRLPYLVKQGFSGKIYAIAATKDIVEVALLDAAGIAQEKTGPIIYTKDEVLRVCDLIEPVSYDVPLNISSFTALFRNAGHILGSASVEITADSKTIVFSGDLGNIADSLIQPKEYISKANFVVMESTYGDKLHPKENPEDVLQQEIREIEKSGGALLIPAFSIERSQEIIHRLGHLRKDNKISNSIPIFLDSPMAIEVMEIFKKYPKLYSNELAHDKSPFAFPNLILTDSAQKSKSILESKGAKIIIAGSGMMSGGRILHHIYNYISNPTTRILIVGYQAVGTLGQKILKGDKQITMQGKQLPVRATITNLQSLSSHADQSELLHWLKVITGVEKVFLVHGEEPQREVLAEKIKSEISVTDVILPKIDEEFEIN